MKKPHTRTIFSVGHSNVPFETFARLLELHDVQVVADVRSYPFSKYAKHFDTDNIRVALKQVGYMYVFLGNEVGGKPRGQQFYDADGRLIYGKVAETSVFKTGIDRLLSGLESYRIALMCGEENPLNCHRRHLIASTLAQHNVEVLHIRGDGGLQTESDLQSLERRPAKNHGAEQLSLFNF